MPIKIAISAVAMVVAGGVTLMLVENARLRDVYLSGQRADLERRLHAEKSHLVQTVDTLRRDALFLSNTPPVSGIMRATLKHGYDSRHDYSVKVWEERLQQIFSAFSAAHPEYYQIRYIGVADGGRELVRVDNRAGKIEVTLHAGLQAKGGRDYFKAALGLHAGEVHLSEFNLNREWGAIEQPYRPTLRAVTPVFTLSGEIFGMVAINMDAGRLFESVVPDVSNGILAYIANMSGEYLFHPDASRYFGFELDGESNIFADFPSLKTIFGLQASEPHFLQAAGAKAGYLAAEKVHFDPGNPARFLLLAYHLPEAVAARQIATIPARHIAGGFAAMLLVSVIALFVLRRLFAPLEQVTEAARKIAAGDYDVQLPQGGSGEIVSLVGAFDNMRAKLSQREQEIASINEGLEKRVRERTLELEWAHRETAAMSRRNRALLQASMDGIHIMDLHGNLLEANDAFCRMLGYTQEEAAHLNAADWCVQFTGEELQAQFRGDIGNSALIETVYRRKDGMLIDVEIGISGVEIDSRIFVFASARDITGRKKAEESLLIAAAAFETQDAIAVADAGGNIVRVNHAFSAITGYSQGEVIGESLGMVERGSQNACADMLQQSIRDGTWTGETYGMRKNGEIYPKWLTVTAIKNECQEIAHYVAIFSDITARKQAEQAKQRESEERFRGTLEQVAVGIAHASLDGRFEHVNQKFCAITGYGRDELLQMSFHDITFPGDLSENLHCIQQLLAGEISTFSIEKRYVRKDRNLIWVNLTVSALRDAGGAPKYTIGVIEDITERKQSEALLQQFGHLLQSSFNEIYLLDAHNSHFLLASKGAEDNLGYSTDELNCLVFQDICPSLTEGYLTRVAALPARGRQLQLIGAEFVRKDGTVYPVEMRTQYMDSDFPVFMIVAQDITGRMQAEEALLAGAQKYQLLFESSRDALMLLAPPSWRFTKANCATLQLFGASDEAGFTELGPWDVSPVRQPDGRHSSEKALEMIAIAMRDGSNLFGWEHRRIDGRVFAADVLLTRMETDEGTFLQASVRDITERNRWEQQLRSLTAHIQAVREEEKANIAREIHDHLGGTLTALKMDIYWLADKLPANRQAAPLLEHIEAMSQLLDNAVAVTRQVITALRPTMLDDLGLHAALEWQMKQFQKRTGIQCRIECACPTACGSRLDKVQTINLFRIFQESLTNIARHSGASRVEAELLCEDEEVVLTISDNGCGLPKGHTLTGASYGMLGMRERAEQLGGRVNFYSPPGGGLSVTVVLPLRTGGQNGERT